LQNVKPCDVPASMTACPQPARGRRNLNTIWLRMTLSGASSRATSNPEFQSGATVVEFGTPKSVAIFSFLKFTVLMAILALRA